MVKKRDKSKLRRNSVLERAMMVDTAPGHDVGGPCEQDVDDAVDMEQSQD